MKTNNYRFCLVSLIVVFLFSTELVNAQYFGQNRPIYKRLDFKVYKTPNFEIYHYFDNDSIVERLAQASEQWYNMHLQVFRDTIKERNPIIFYANHADFQQTTAIFGSVGVGTGGVTEALKNRVVMPVTESWAQTDHVLGHELVHAFQFNSILTKDSTNLNSLRNLPLWMIEGMAEYLSIGSVDPHTAMWMRDAVLNDDFPTLDKMTRDPNYFPYRYGHAFWAFVGRTFGDSLIRPIFLETAKRGYEIALLKYLGLDEKSFSNIWKKTYEEHFKMMMKDSVDNPSGIEIIHKDNAGYINISPAISPDGNYVAFYSEQDLFSIDLFLAETATGRTIQKLSSVVHDNEIDALNFIESAGTWSPDSKQFAFIAFSKGKNRLLIVDVALQKVVQEIEIPKVASFNYPTWSPDGKSIVVSGLVDGNNNLYQYFLESGTVVKLTNDPWSNIHPSWSPDGKTLVYVTDIPAPSDITTQRMPGFYLTTLDLETTKRKTHHFFPGASNLNPIFAPNGEDIYFLSDRDGFRNLYRFNIISEQIFQETDILTGISGITKLAPAFSVSPETGKVAYSYYFKGKYSIFTALPEDFISREVDPMNVDATAATLPPLNRSTPGIIDRNIAMRMGQPETPVDSFFAVRYRPKFKLDYISNIGIGISTGYMGTGMAGGVEMLFSDIIGANIFHVGLSLNGEIYDFGGQLTYINQKNRVMWAATVSHIPYSYAMYGYSNEILTDGTQDYFVEYSTFYQFRIFETVTGGMAQLPISKARRFEVGGYLSWYNYRVDEHTYQYINGFYNGYKRTKGDAPEGYSLQKVNMAYVVDNSFFGIASPVDGTRQRFQVDKVFGYVDYWGTLADFRKYIRVKPFTFAFKAFYYGRHGSDLSKVYPLNLGYPWLIRGYDYGTFNEQLALGNPTIDPDQLMGNHIALTNFEIRIPFTGPERLSVIKSKFLFTELALFTDVGLAWNNKDDIKFKWQADNFTERIPVVSAGVSLRINLFGMLILEPYYAVPFQLGGFKAITFGLNFTPGW
jgi:Tol biopolymer transport system component